MSKLLITLVLIFGFVLPLAAESKVETTSDIVDVAANNADFSTLVMLLGTADLADSLKDQGPFTVFAPNDDAFKALGQETLDSLLLPENRDKLKNILLFHVVAGKVMSGEIQDGATVTTLEGQTLTLSIKDGKVFVNDAEVIIPDVDGSNGVIHGINKVLMPPES